MDTPRQTDVALLSWVRKVLGTSQAAEWVRVGVAGPPEGIAGWSKMHGNQKELGAGPWLPGPCLTSGHRSQCHWASCRRVLSGGWRVIMMTLIRGSSVQFSSTSPEAPFSQMLGVPHRLYLINQARFPAVGGGANVPIFPGRKVRQGGAHGQPHRATAALGEILRAGFSSCPHLQDHSPPKGAEWSGTAWFGSGSFDESEVGMAEREAGTWRMG